MLFKFGNIEYITDYLSAQQCFDRGVAYLHLPDGRVLLIAAWIETEDQDPEPVLELAHNVENRLYETTHRFGFGRMTNALAGAASFMTSL